MTLLVFYFATFLAVIVILLCMHLDQNCSFSRLIKEYRQKQYERNGIIRANLDVKDLISCIDVDRLRYCYGIKICDEAVGEPILYTSCDWDINDKLKGLYRSRTGNVTKKFIK